jgi:hypothetical protein
MFEIIKKRIESNGQKLTIWQQEKLKEKIAKRDFVIPKGNSSQQLDDLVNQFSRSLVSYNTKAQFDMQDYLSKRLNSSTYDEVQVENKGAIDKDKTFETMGSGSDNKPNPATVYTTSIMSIFGETSVSALKTKLLPSSMYKKAYISLDSKNRRLDIRDPSVFSWYYSVARIAGQQGTVSSTSPIKKIIAIKLYQPVIPATSNLDPISQRVSILINEFKNYAYINNGGFPYHWMFRWSYTNNTSGLAPRHVDLNLDEFGDGIYKFPKPLNLYDSITLTFGNPNEQMIFNRDRDEGIVSSYGATTTITMNNQHNLNTGDLVYIKGFTTNTQSYNNLNINTVYGLIVNVIGLSTFTVPVDTSSVDVSWIANQPIECFYAPFRLLMPMEIVYMDDAI